MMPGVYLFSSDGISNPIYLDDEAAKLSRAIQEYRQSFLSNYIRLEYKCATEEALSLVAKFCKTHAADGDDLIEWTSNLKNLHPNELLEIMKAARYLEIKGLMDFCDTAVDRSRFLFFPVELREIQKEEDTLSYIRETRKREAEARKRGQEERMKKQRHDQKELEDEEKEMRILDELLANLVFRGEHGTSEESTQDQEEEDQEEEDQEEHKTVEESAEDQEEGGNEDSG